MNPFAKYILIGCSIIAMIILLDSFVSKEIEETITYLGRKMESHNNASRNFHFSYEVKTTDRQFFVSGDLYNQLKVDSKVTLGISPFFQEVNKCNGRRPLLRLLSGVILPLLMLITGWIAMKFKNKVSTLVFVLEVMILADFIALIR
ncbi:MAG: hypothetical protein JXQ90_15230 [Cyclobacteriaceae bacterium]